MTVHVSFPHSVALRHAQTLPWLHIVAEIGFSIELLLNLLIFFLETLSLYQRKTGKKHFHIENMHWEFVSQRHFRHGRMQNKSLVSWSSTNQLAQFLVLLSFPFFSSVFSSNLVPFLSLSLSSCLQKMSQEFEIKRLSLEEQRDRLQQQLDNLKEELSAKLNMANQEVWVSSYWSANAWPAWPDRLHVYRHVSINWVVVSSGVPPSGAGERGGTEPEFSSDADYLSEGNSGETQDRARRDSSPRPRDEQPADWPTGEEKTKTEVWRTWNEGPPALTPQ